jgi:hypothetical protein
MKVNAELVWLEPNKDAADDVEDEVSHKLCAGDAYILGEFVRNASVEGWPNGTEADKDHLATNDGLNAIPDEGEKDSIQDGKVGTINT